MNSLDVLESIDIDFGADEGELFFHVIDQDGKKSTEVIYAAHTVREKNTLAYVLREVGKQYTDNCAIYLNGDEVPPHKYDQEWIYSGSVIELKPKIHK